MALSAALLGCLALLGLSVARLAGAGPLPALVVIAAGAAGLAGVVLALGWAGNRSPGALDNASGLAVLLELARRTEGPEIAYLITDGEELGLAGARAVADRLPAVQGVINLDGLDDRGRIRVAEGHGWRRKGSAPQLAAAVLSAARALDMDVDRRPLPWSVPVDHGPLAAAGIPALTVLRGDWRSLARVHRPGDDPGGITGTGAAATATLLTVALGLLRDSQAAHLAARQGNAS
ncbi:MAG: M28 family peptidase [Gemmatimonadetes bacterium]|nr:M28 family peptidase [Gemmatimonadota bacterium]NIQ57777.1 M28 family peptidase [Gemmatimonadota bacterium]NIU77933.1 M28 family peptidase [Gammaproteobacteria bacterium]NIX47024.1 M28 family peptidase [Gemmatimonadota bacterium]NIY11389.1 M28 family peptidase [Gemmatimonadota bacterium]